MKLIYRTRGNSSPQGKPRVYFTGHPEDLPVYAEEIFADILKTQNCAIYYDAEPDIPCDTEELLRQLEQMQMFVIPITRTFLTRKSRALDVEFPFAMEHRIPVMPLLQEQGLESAFNEVCGDLQMLNKNDPDPTALPYAEKMEKFMASILVGDELAAKVRAAFDAYVFLSYRKKDRKYAQELMRLIHKNEFCRDIAIWYDEFLIPGENFNEAIADALKKSSLFALAVTPNIMEPGNYVMTLEYPRAKESGKPILPVELVPTDPSVLQNAFQDIPPCADARNEGAFSSALLEAVQKLAIQENDSSLEHNFFIGLAYLNGIDVEVDRERALALITGAAEGGLPEAMEKLVSMYQNGDGVARSFSAAIQWQTRLADWWQARFEESGAERDGISWLNALDHLGNAHKSQNALASARQIYQRMQEISLRLIELFGSRQDRQYLSLSCQRLGLLCEMEGQPAEARDYYSRCFEIDVQQYNEHETLLGAKVLSADCIKLGDLCEVEGKLSMAREYFQKSLTICRMLYEATGAAAEKRDVAIGYHNLGRISGAEGQLAEALNLYSQAWELFKQLYDETPTPQATADFAAGYDRLGDICKAVNRPAEAKGLYAKGQALRSQLCDDVGTATERQELAASYSRLGDACMEEGRLAEAREHYQQGYELRKQLYDEAKTMMTRRDLSISYGELGSVCQAEGRQSEAMDFYLQSLELDKQLYRESRTPMAKRDLAISYSKLGGLCQAMGQRPEALYYYMLGLDLNQQLSDEAGTAETKRALVVNYFNVGKIQADERKLHQAMENWKSALNLSQELCKQTDLTMDLNLSAILSYHIGCLKVADVELKKTMLQQADRLWSRLGERHPDVPDYAQLRDDARAHLAQLETSG